MSKGTCTRDVNMLRGARAGAIGGILGTLAMNYAQRLWTRAAGDAPPSSAGGKHDARDWQERTESQNANELAAQAVARRLIGRQLTEKELEVAAPLVHFAFGAAVAAAYGAYVETIGSSRSGAGVALGVTLWLAADEVAMPLMGLSRPTTERPTEMHLQALAAHIVYGVVTEFTRQHLRDRAMVA
jgi:hypothetical protein